MHRSKYIWQRECYTTCTSGDVKVRGLWLDVDVESVAIDLDLQNIKSTATEVICCCPSNRHEDNRPSFGISRDSGLFNCFSCGFKGDLVDLVGHVLGLGPFQSLRWLAEQFTPEVEKRDPIELFPDQESPYLDKSILDEYKWRHPYLESRGIPEGVQRKFGVGYDRDKAAISLPYFTVDGQLLAIKFRSVITKEFWFKKNKEVGLDLTVYGIHLLKKFGLEEAYVTEGEIDCMTCWAAKLPAVAAGTKGLSKRQVELLARTGIKKVNLFLDNDEAGRLGTKESTDRLMEYVKVNHVIYPDNSKDPNELGTEKLSYIKVI